jgi:hypothetical protein
MGSAWDSLGWGGDVLGAGAQQFVVVEGRASFRSGNVADAAQYRDRGWIAHSSADWSHRCRQFVVNGLVTLTPLFGALGFIG